MKDAEVTEMAERLRRLIRAPSKTEAAPKALANAVEAALGRPSLAARIKEAVAMARRIAAPDPEFDQKAFSDEMWGL
ncbi:MAG TPA: type II toxin-antitoxin system VapB family antitoxin [Roseiarcus sp.]|nr:type II toxin-antitoxin system VapB family antitoxin [Roseiarcus sp.]